MNANAQTLRNRLRNAEQDLAAAKNEVANLEARCQHRWSAPVSDPIVRKGYTETGSQMHVGAHNIEHSVYVPERVTPRWRQTCLDCGKEETTTSFEEKVTTTLAPRW